MNKILGAVAILALTTATICGCKKHDYPGDLSPIAVPGSSDTSRNGNGNGGDTTHNGNGNNPGGNGGYVSVDSSYIVWEGNVPLGNACSLDLGQLQAIAGVSPASFGPGYPLTWSPGCPLSSTEDMIVVGFKNGVSTDSVKAWEVANNCHPTSLPEHCAFLYGLLSKTLTPTVPVMWDSVLSNANKLGSYPQARFVSLGTWLTAAVDVRPTGSNVIIGVSFAGQGPNSAGFHLWWSGFTEDPTLPWVTESNDIPILFVMVKNGG